MADGSWLMAMADEQSIDHEPSAIAMSHQPLAMAGIANPYQFTTAAMRSNRPWMMLAGYR